VDEPEHFGAIRAHALAEQRQPLEVAQEHVP
jgi:hypothetical protein